MRQSAYFIIFWAVLTSPLISFGKAQTPLCSRQKILITAYYGERGEYPAELLDKWSEQSGDLIQLEVSKTSKINFIEMQFLDDKKNEIKKINLPLQKNKTAQFQFIKMLSQTTPRASEVLLSLWHNKEKSICHENIEIFKGAEMGATEVKNGKK